MAINHYIRTLDGSVNRQVYPKNNMGLGTVAEAKDTYQYREELNDAITLINTKQSRDYSFILNIEQGNNPTIDKYDILLYVIEDTIEPKTYNYIFQVISADFDRRNSLLTITPELNDAYTPFYKNQKEKANVLLTVPKHEITYKGKSYLEWALGYTPFGGVPVAPVGLNWEGWGIFGYQALPSKPLRTHQAYAKEVVFVESGLTPSGTNWDLETNGDAHDKYSRTWSEGGYAAATPDPSTFIAKELFTSNITIPDGSIWKKILNSVLGNTFIKKTYDDFTYTQNNVGTTWMYLRDVISTVINQTIPDFGGLVKSSFLFNDNYEDGTSSGSNNYISGFPNPLKEIYLIENSDAKKPNASNKATIEWLSLDELFSDLQSQFWGKLFWYIDTSGNYRIEHKEILSTNVGIDLEDVNIKDYESLTNYSYDENRILNRETLRFEEQSSDDWNETYVIYNTPLIASIGENKKEYSVKLINSDLDNLTAYPQNVSNKGLKICITEETAGVRSVKLETGISSFKSVQNAGLSCMKAEVLYGEAQKPLRNFEVKNVSGTSLNNTADSLEPIKIEANEFTYTGAINYQKTIKTPLGNGRIDKLTRLFNTKNVVAKLLQL